MEIAVDFSLLLKMSVLSEAESFTVAITRKMDSIVSDVQSKLGSEIVNFGSELENTATREVANIKTGISEIKADINADIASFTTQIDALKNKAESAVESALSDAVKQMTSLGDTLKKLGTKTQTGLQDASAYMRHGMVNDLEAAIAAIMKKFDDLESGFKNLIKGHADDYIAFVKKEIANFVASAQSDLSDVSSLRNDLITKLSSEAGSIKDDLEAAKNKMHAALDKVIAFGKGEIAKLEARAIGVKDTLESVALRASGFALGLAVIYFIFEVVRKHMAADEEHEKEVKFNYNASKVSWTRGQQPKIA